MRHLSVLIVALAFVACAHTPVHPGAANAFDSGAFDSLLVAQQALEQAKTEAGADPAARRAVNVAIAAYNAALDGFSVYHLAVTHGQNPDTAALAAQIVTLVADVAAAVQIIHPAATP